MSKNYYDILGCDKQADSTIIRKNFHQLAMKHHPDKNINKAITDNKFNLITEAYNILSKPELKKKYDLFGSTDDTPNINMSPFEIFKDLFGNDINFKVAHVDLNIDSSNIDNLFKNIPIEMNKGVLNALMGIINSSDMKNMPIFPQLPFEKILQNFLPINNSNIQQPTINPINNIFNTFLGLEQNANDISSNHLNRFKKVDIKITLPITLRELYTGVVKQVDIEKLVNIEGLLVKKKIVKEISIDRGFKVGNTIVLSEQGNESIEGINGDIIIKVIDKPDSLYSKNGNDLVIIRKILLSEVLCGYEFILKKINGDYVVIKSNPDLEFKKLRRIKGYGLPYYNNSGNIEYGDLIIHFSVIYPKLDKNGKKYINKILPVRKPLTKKLDNIPRYSL